jgi:aspartyl/asparaginyl-tRNA synthetase
LSNRRTLVVDLLTHLGQVVRTCGLVCASAPRQAQLVLADHTGHVSLVNVTAEVTCGSAVDVVGVVLGAPDEPAGIAIMVQCLDVVGRARPGSPLDGCSTLEERLDWRYLDLRRPGSRLIFQVQTTLEHAMREVWEREGFVELHSPKLMATGPRPEELFSLDYFGRRAWLVQSPQFYKQMAMAAGFDRVFEVGPVFRAEPALSTRHSTEFTSVDVEMSWIASEVEVMTFGEELLAHAITEVATRHGEEIARVLGTKVEVPRVPFPRIGLAEAWEVVTRRGHSGGAGDLDAEGERLLSRHVAERHGHQLVWVTDYPEDLRPFYHMRSAEGSAISRSFDLVYKGMEVASGAQREHRYEILVAQAQARSLPFQPIAHYLDFFRYGCPSHGGLGFGLNRLLMSLLELPDVREATYLPRDRDRLSP